MLRRLRHGLSGIYERLQRRSRGYEVDMCNGPLLGKMVKFALPLALSSVLQLLFHATDVIVVGRYAGSTALAAVGATGTVTNLFVTVFIGLSVGTNVMTARYYAAGKANDLFKVVHTSIALSITFGVLLLIVGQLVTTPILTIMNTPSDVIGQASLYMKIIFLGMPAQLTYNFGAAVLRAMGDTRRPLYYLSFAGAINVITNLFLVIVVGLGVEGVAIATITAQYISASLILVCLLRSETVYKLILKQLRIDKDKLFEIMKVGVPAGVQSAMFIIANVLIQSSINSFGSTVMAASTAAASLESFVFVSLNAFHQTAVTFVSQNLGGKKYSRIPKIASQCSLIAVLLGLVLGVGIYAFSTPLLGIYNSDPEVIEYGRERLLIMCAPYFICGLMDVINGVLRGMGYSVLSMVTSLLGVCLVRIIWIYTAFQFTQSLEVLFLSYPITWTITGIAGLIQFNIIKKRLPSEV